ncbi:MAG: hypothetical protein Q9211_004666 [Gyalolechia sp. 1 TL-2023]
MSEYFTSDFTAEEQGYEVPDSSWSDHRLKEWRAMRAYMKMEREAEERRKEFARTQPRNDPLGWDAMDRCPSPLYRTMPGYNGMYQTLRPGRLCRAGLRCSSVPPNHKLPSPPASPPHQATPPPPSSTSLDPTRAFDSATFRSMPTTNCSSHSSIQSSPTAAQNDQSPASPTNVPAPLSEASHDNGRGDVRHSNPHKRKFIVFPEDHDGDCGQGAGIVLKKLKWGTEDRRAAAVQFICVGSQMKAEAPKEHGFTVTPSEASAGAKTIYKGYVEGTRNIVDVVLEIGLEQDIYTAQSRSMSTSNDLEAGVIDVKISKATDRTNPARISCTCQLPCTRWTEKVGCQAHGRTTPYT